ncbi:MAG: hypothetical protein QOJ02_3557 [Acidobacteriota bacterium]|nr:hypothetical protein [Acidobacteriota bacterium]
MLNDPSPSSLSNSILARLQPRWALLALLAELLIGGWHDAMTLLKYPVAVGIDGYYYVLQVNELQYHGHFYFPTSTPLILYALAGLSRLTGDSVLAIKIGSIILHAALCFGIFALIAGATRSRWLGVLGSALAVISSAHFYMIGEFINNLGAVTFLIWCGWFTMRAFQTRRNIWILLACVSLIAATFSHRSALLLAMILALSLFLMRLLISTKSRGLRLAGILTILIIWCAPAILVLQPLVQLPAWLQGDFSSVPSLPLSRVGVAEQLLLMVLAPATLIIITLGRRRPEDNIASLIFGSVALWGLLTTLNPFLNHNREWIGVTWRLSMLAYIQVAILVPGVIWLVIPFKREALFYIAALVLPLMIWSMRDSLPYGMRGEYLSERAEMVKRLPLYRQQLGPNSLIISPHGDQFVVTSVLGVPSQQRWPNSNTYDSIYWLLHQVGPHFLTPSMTVLMPEREGLYTVLAKDDEVSQQMKAIGPFEQRQLLISNPHLHDYVFHR